MHKGNVIITGATGNLGRVVVSRFLEAGFRVTASVSSSTQLKSSTANLDYHQVDLTDEAQTNAFVNEAIKKSGSIQSAILLAGGFRDGNIEQTSSADIQEMLALNFNTAYHVAHSALRNMKHNGYGRIVLIGARPALHPDEAVNKTAYSLSKSLLFALAEILNAAGKQSNIATTVIVPGTIDTPANRKAMPEADFSQWVSPEAITAKILRICIDESYAARHPIISMF